MKIIIAPAKKMRVDTDSFACHDMPQFLEYAEYLLEVMKSKSYDELKKLWNCSDRIAKPNFENLERLNLRKNLTPALMSYDGIAYRYMAPDLFTYDELDYVKNHLRILSGFYGILRPFDGVVPYRLEMQAKLETEKGKTLYDFWGDELAKSLFEKEDTVINLASEEYSRCISRYPEISQRFITCIFGTFDGEKIKENGTQCKMARGEMVRFMAENKIEQPQEIKEFNRLGYQYCEKLSDERNYVFLK